MDWISSTEFIEMLKRFPHVKIEARRYLGKSLTAFYEWEYRNESKTFVYHLNRKTKEFTESKFRKQFASDHWFPKQFIFLNDEKQRSLAVHIVEHLIMTDNLDWIICDCNINFVRECVHCHCLMNEGLLCGDTYTYCSEECLLAENPGITKEELNKLMEDDDSQIYWTEWEE